MISLASCREFILSNTNVKSPPLVPELRLHLARHAHDIFQNAHTFATGGLGARPYWAYAWPGGQALARHILDHPALVRGLSILDLGAGSGIGGIAAMAAGAQAVLAADVDPLAACVVQMNAKVNGVVVDATTDDLLGQDTAFDLIVVGDLVTSRSYKTASAPSLRGIANVASQFFMATGRQRGGRPGVSPCWPSIGRR